MHFSISFFQIIKILPKTKSLVLTKKITFSRSLPSSRNAETGDLTEDVFQQVKYYTRLTWDQSLRHYMVQQATARVIPEGRAQEYAQHTFVYGPKQETK